MSPNEQPHTHVTRRSNALHAPNVRALKWVEYDGRIPVNAVMVYEGTEDAVVCRATKGGRSRVGLFGDKGFCITIGLVGFQYIYSKDDGFHILVDTSEPEIIELEVMMEETYT